MVESRSLFFRLQAIIIREKLFCFIFFNSLLFQNIIMLLHFSLWEIILIILN